jgi:hypothetical protein
MKIVTRQEALLKGLPKYFTGSPCKRGHTATRWTLTSNCDDCVRESNKRTRDAFRLARQQ